MDRDEDRSGHIVHGRLVDFGHPDQYSAVPHAGKTNMEYLMAQWADGGQIIERVIIVAMVAMMHLHPRLTTSIRGRPEIAAAAGEIIALKSETAVIQESFLVTHRLMRRTHHAPACPPDVNFKRYKGVVTHYYRPLPTLEPSIP